MRMRGNRCGLQRWRWRGELDVGVKWGWDAKGCQGVKDEKLRGLRSHRFVDWYAVSMWAVNISMCWADCWATQPAHPTKPEPSPTFSLGAPPSVLIPHNISLLTFILSRYATLCPKFFSLLFLPSFSIFSVICLDIFHQKRWEKTLYVL